MPTDFLFSLIFKISICLLLFYIYFDAIHDRLYFPLWLHWFTLLPRARMLSSFSTSLPAFATVCDWDFSHSARTEGPSASDVAHVLISLLPPLFFPFENCLLKFLPIFQSNWLFWLLDIFGGRYWNIQNTRPLSIPPCYSLKLWRRVRGRRDEGGD